MNSRTLLSFFGAGRSGKSLKSFRQNDSGATAVEFGIVALPFLMMLYGIIAVGIFFFTTFSLENAVEQAGRMLRTGQAQNAATPWNEARFKQEVCSRAPGFIDCGANLKVFVQAFGDFNGIAPKSCLEGGALSATGVFEPGAASQVVLVTACYEWELAAKIPFLNLGNMGNGARLIQAGTTFRTEPFDN